MGFPKVYLRDEKDYSATGNLATKMTQFATQAERESHCKLCLNALPAEGHKKEKDRIAKIKTCCGSCGNHCCKKHYNLVCTECSPLFVPQQ